MQYPIIDLIADAYLNNGWTGLDISTGKNIVAPFSFNGAINGVTFTSDNYKINLQGTASSNGGRTWRLTNVFTLTAGPYALSMVNETGGNLNFFIETANNDTVIATFNNDTVTLNTDTDVYIGCNLSFGSTYDGNVYLQLEVGSHITPYEPPGIAKNDFPNRLKLPLPHYFPHPVIDALQRAAAGTQTTDDTEILRHYLTPLGIGGI